MTDKSKLTTRQVKRVWAMMFKFNFKCRCCKRVIRFIDLFEDDSDFERGLKCERCMKKQSDIASYHENYNQRLKLAERDIAVRGLRR